MRPTKVHNIPIPDMTQMGECRCIVNGKRKVQIRVNAVDSHLSIPEVTKKVIEKGWHKEIAKA